jgi:hypothetical protein
MKKKEMRGSGSKEPWPMSHVKILMEYAGKSSAAEIADTIGRTEGAIRQKAYELDISMSMHRKEKQKENNDNLRKKLTPIMKEFHDTVNNLVGIFNAFSNALKMPQRQLREEAKGSRFHGGVSWKGIRGADFLTKILKDHDGRCHKDVIVNAMERHDPPFAPGTVKGLIREFVNAGLAIKEDESGHPTPLNTINYFVRLLEKEVTPPTVTMDEDLFVSLTTEKEKMKDG